MKNKVVIVTGANSGVGFEIAKILSSSGAKVIIACRDEANGVETQKQINGDSEYVNLDLSSFSSIDRFVETIAMRYQEIDVLVNNAGVMFPPLTRTTQQLELTFGVNYIGYYRLTNRVMPLLRRVRGSRVVNMSSIAQYRIDSIDWDNINSENRYNKRESYDLSNLFRIMFTIELEEKLREKRYETIAVSCHPGVTLTNLTRSMSKILTYPLLTKIMNKLVFHTPYDAAMPALMATSSPNVRGGDFVGFDTKKQYKGNPKVVEPNPLANDKVLRETLWHRSVEITGLDLE